MAKRKKRTAKRRTAKRRSTKQKHETPGWAWGAVGLSIGLSVAAAIYVKDRRPESPAPPEPAATTVAPEPVFDDNSETVTPATTPDPADEGDEQRFTFYEMLLRSEVVVGNEDAGAGSREPIAVVEPGTYALQVGSFSTEQDADRRRAELALQGIESDIQKASVNNNIYYRVRIGPTDDLDELNLIRSRLRAARIDALIVREVD